MPGKAAEALVTDSLLWILTQIVRPLFPAASHSDQTSHSIRLAALESFSMTSLQLAHISVAWPRPVATWPRPVGTVEVFPTGLAPVGFGPSHSQIRTTPAECGSPKPTETSSVGREAGYFNSVVARPRAGGAMLLLVAATRR
jgi:hypothetical protein